MKRSLSLMAVSFVLMLAVSAMAQDSSPSPVQNQILAPASPIGSVVGKMVSIFSSSGAGQVTIAAFPSFTTVASTTVPTKYKSKTQWLIAQTTLQERCNDWTVSTVEVNGIHMYPDDQGLTFYECWNSTSFETRTRTWVFPPENLGGPVIPPGSTVNVLMASGAGTSAVEMRSIIVQAVK